MAETEEQKVETPVVEKKEKTTLKSLKKDFEDFKAEVFKRLPIQPLLPVHGFAPVHVPEDVMIPETPAETSITFTFHDRFKEARTFTEADNGPEWREMANAFQSNNESQIKKREDL